MTGSKRVADAKPDGYTMVLGSVGTHAQNQTLYKHPLYNVVNDFTPVAYLAITPIAIITRPDLPVNNFKEFIAYAKANQAKMQYGSAGAGSATHLACVVLDSTMGTKITHVPYKGTGPAMQDLVGGRIDYLCDIIATAKPQIDGGKVKGIAIMTKDRSPVLPNLATTGEQGTDVQAYTWSALFLPKGAPADVVKKLNEAAVGALSTPSVQERLAQLGATVAGHRMNAVRNGSAISSKAKSKNGKSRSRRAAYRLSDGFRYEALPRRREKESRWPRSRSSTRTRSASRSVNIRI